MKILSIVLKIFLLNFILVTNANATLFYIKVEKNPTSETILESGEEIAPAQAGVTLISVDDPRLFEGTEFKTLDELISRFTSLYRGARRTELDHYFEQILKVLRSLFTLIDGAENVYLTTGDARTTGNNPFYINFVNFLYFARAHLDEAPEHVYLMFAPLMEEEFFHNHFDFFLLTRPTYEYYFTIQTQMTTRPGAIDVHRQITATVSDAYFEDGVYTPLSGDEVRTPTGAHLVPHAVTPRTAAGARTGAGGTRRASAPEVHKSGLFSSLMGLGGGKR